MTGGLSNMSLFFKGYILFFKVTPYKGTLRIFFKELHNSLAHTVFDNTSWPIFQKYSKKFT